MVRVGSEERRRERQEFEGRVVASEGSCTWVADGQEGRLEFWEERLEEAAVVVKATTTATGNKNKYKISMEIRRMATATAKCRNPVLRKDLRKKQGRLEENLMPGWVQVPGARLFRGPP